MALQGFGGAESLAAQRALALGDIDVGVAVVLLERRICKVGGAAQVAHIGALHLGVQLHVPLQIGLEREAVMANVALEEIISLMHAYYMLIQSILGGELGAAHLTDGTVGLVAGIFKVLLHLLLGQLQAALAARKGCNRAANIKISLTFNRAHLIIIMKCRLSGFWQTSLALVKFTFTSTHF